MDMDNKPQQKKGIKITRLATVYIPVIISAISVILAAFSAFSTSLRIDGTVWIIFLSIVAFCLFAISILYMRHKLREEIDVEKLKNIEHVSSISVDMAMKTDMLATIRKVSKMRFVYVSFCDHDKELITHIVSALLHEEKNNITRDFLLLNSHTFFSGELNDEMTRECISYASITLLFISDNYLADEKCIREFEIAAEKPNRIIPIVIDSLDNLSKLPKDLGNTKALSMTTLNEIVKNNSAENHSRELQEQIALLNDAILEKRNELLQEKTNDDGE